MNTLIKYMYRDASNYKQFHAAVLDGCIAESDIRQTLWEGAYFIPSLVGLPDLLEKFKEQGFIVPNEDDHPWHEIESVFRTTQASTVNITAGSFLQCLRNCSDHGWERFALIEEAKLRGPATLDA